VFTACVTMHRRRYRLVTWMRWNYIPPYPGCKPVASSVHYTTSCKHSNGAPEDGRNYRRKHIELIEIINKPLLLHLVGYLY